MKRIIIRFFTLLSIVALSSCGNDRPDSAGTTGGAAGGIGEDGSAQITIYTWEDYLVPELLERFTEETGIDVNVETFGTTDELVDRLKSNPGRYDVLVCDSPVGSILADLRLVRQLDYSALPSLGNIDPRYLDLDTDKGNRVSVPYFWGTTLVAYNTKHLPDPEQSWSILFDPSLKGKVMMYNEKDEMMSAALFQCGKEPFVSDLESVELAKQTLLAQIEDVECVYGTDADGRAAIVNEEVWATMMYSGDAVYIGDDNPDIDFFLPKEGVTMWVDSFFIARDASNAAGGHRFIEFMLQPDVAAESSNYYCYATPNREALPLIDEDLRDDERIYLTDEMKARVYNYIARTPELEQGVTTMARDVLRRATGGVATAASP